MKKWKEKIYGKTRSNMSTVMNEGDKMHWKSVTEKFITVVGPLVEPSSTYIENPKVSIESSISIRQTTITSKSYRPVIPTYLHSSFFLSSILRSNGRIHQSRGWQWSNVESYVINSAALCVPIIIPGKMKCLASRNSLSII